MPRRALPIGLMAALSIVAALPAQSGTQTGAGTVQAQPVLKDDPMVAIVPAGVKLDAQLRVPLDSALSHADERFELVLLLAYAKAGKTLLPVGSIIQGFVGSVHAANDADRTGSLTLSFDELRIGEQRVRLRATVEQALVGKTAELPTRINAGAVERAALDRAPTRDELLPGVFVRPNGTMASTRVTDVIVPAGTILRLRVDQPITVGEIR